MHSSQDIINEKNYILREIKEIKGKENINPENIEIIENYTEIHEIKEEIIPPTLMSCYTKGILEKSILQFLTKNEQIILFSCNKSLSKLTINILKDAISQYKQDYDILIGETIDDKIKGLEEKYSKYSNNSKYVL